MIQQSPFSNWEVKFRNLAILASKEVTKCENSTSSDGGHTFFNNQEHCYYIFIQEVKIVGMEIFLPQIF